MPYLVDGNNLAHALGLVSGGLPDRESCTRAVAVFCRTQGAKATLVFDGKAAGGPHPPARTDRVDLVFSGSSSADEVILRMISSSKTPRDFTVVTSDKSLGDKARHRGATVERAHEFARRLDRPRGKKGAALVKPSAWETPEQIEAWLAVFERKQK